MKAIQAHPQGGLDGLTLVDLPDPGNPGPHAIRVRVHATSLNFHDLGVVTGRLPAADGRIPMADGAGVVEAVIHLLSDLVGRRSDPGRLRHHAGRRDRRLCPGGGGGTGHVLHARTSRLEPRRRGDPDHGWGDRLARPGGQRRPEGRGQRAGSRHGRHVDLRVADRAGHGATVIATSSSDEKLERLRTMGAAHGINYRRDEDWGDRVRELTGGMGMDHVVEVGGPGPLGQSIKATRVGGHISLIGVLTGQTGTVPTAMLMARQQRLQGLIVGSRRHQMDLIRGIDAVHVHPVIDRSFPLDAIADAFRLQETGGHFGKIVIEF